MSFPKITPWSPGRVVRVIVAASLTAFVLWKANPSTVFHVSARANLWWIAAAIVLVVVDRGLMAYRWLILLCPIAADARPPFAAVMRVFFISTFLGTFLPAIGGEAVRAFGLARLSVAPGAAVASVMMDRLLGVLSIVLLGLTGLMAARTGDVASNRAIEISLLAASAGCVVGGLIVFSQTAADLATRLALRLPFARVRKLAVELMQATRAYARFHRELATVLTASAAVQVLRILQAYCLGRALGMETALVIYFILIPLILLVMLLPISINAIGTSQVAFVWFFGRVGVPQAEAFALSVLFLALGVVGNLPGGFLYAASPRSTPA